MQEFPIEDILSVTTGRLFSATGMGGVVTLLNYMTGDDVYTHQVPRALRACGPALLAQHPQLAGADTGSFTPAAHAAWIGRQQERFGATLPVNPLPAGQYRRSDPVTELMEMIGGH